MSSTEVTPGGRLLDVAETAKRTTLSHSGVRLAVARGQLKAVRIGRRVLIPESEILRLIAEAS